MRKMILLLAFVFLISLTTAFTANTFNVSLLQENISLTTAGAVRYLPVPAGTSILTTANFNITIPIGSFSGIFNATNYWRFDENTGDAMDSIGAQTLTNNGNNVVYRPGKINNGSNFAAGNSANYTNTGLGSLGSNNFTLAFWILSNVSTVQGVLQSKTGTWASSSMYGIEIGKMVGGTTGRGNITFDDDLGGEQLSTTGVNISNNAWHRIVYTKNSTNGLIVYVDGALNNQLGTLARTSYGATGFQIGGSGTASQTNGFTGMIDDLRLYNSYVWNSSDVTQDWNSGNGLELPNSNFTIGIDGVNAFSDLVNSNDSNVTMNINVLSKVNSYLNTCTPIAGFCNVPFLFNTTAPFTMAYSALNFDSNGFIINNQTYDVNATEGANETFSIYLNYSSSEFPAVAANLIYNGTTYGSILGGSGNNITFTRSISVPTVNTITFYNFYWNILLANNSGSIFSVNTSTLQQQVNNIALDNCTTYTNKILTMNLYDQDTRATQNGSVEYIISLYPANQSIQLLNFSSNLTNINQTSVCIQTLTNTLSMNYQIKFYGANFSNSSDYLQLYKYNQNAQISASNIPQIANLYLLKNTSNVLPFTITVQGTNLANLANAIVDIQRQYIPINQYISVEDPITDINGIAVGYLLTNNQYYNFNIYQNGILLGTFNNQLAVCANPAAGCNINLNLQLASIKIPSFDTIGNISYSFLKNSSQIQMIFSSQDSLIHNISWYVVNNDGYNNQTICTNSIIAQSGVFTCNVPISYVNSTVISTIFADGSLIGTNFFSFGSASSDIFGGTRVILGMLMFSTLVFLFIGSLGLMILGAIMGIGLAGAFHLVDGGSILGNSAIILYIVMGGIIWIYSRNRT